MNCNLSLSIIIPTKDRFEDVQTCVDSILIQSDLPETLIIVDSSDKIGLEDIINKK